MTVKRRGFASMEPEKLRAIASKGGKAAHAKGSAHRFTSAEAKEAGRKGGRAGHHHIDEPKTNGPETSTTSQLVEFSSYPATTEAEFGAPESEEPYRVRAEQI